MIDLRDASLLPTSEKLDKTLYSLYQLRLNSRTEFQETIYTFLAKPLEYEECGADGSWKCHTQLWLASLLFLLNHSFFSFNINCDFYLQLEDFPRQFLELERKMSTTFDLAADLPRALHDRNDTWNFIYGFASHWSQPLKGGDGWSETDIAAAEQRLGVPLPAAFKEAYGLFGRRADLTSNQEHLLAPSDLYFDNGGLVFRHENQGASRWAILATDLSLPDPPVYNCFYMADKAEEKWELWLSRFSLACIDLILWESLHNSSVPIEYRDFGDDEEVELLQQLYKEIPSPEGADSYTPYGFRWFTGGGLLLCFTGTDLFVRAMSPAALNSIREALPGDWLEEW